MCENHLGHATVHIYVYYTGITLQKQSILAKNVTN